MKKVLFIFLIQIVFIITGKAQVSVHFPSNEYQLSVEEIPLLQASLDSLKDRSIEKIIISGYTDNKGSATFNLELSAKRATAVKDFFIGNSIDINKIELQYFGYNDPVENNATEQGREKNRRVEIKYIYTIEDEEDEEVLSDINILYDKVKDKGSEFCIDPTRDTILVADKGTMIVVPANTFSPTKNCTCIKIIFHEYFSMKDFILNNLTTTTNELPMASGGMTRIEAYCNELPVDFNADAALTIMVPTAVPDNDMAIYTADRNNTNDILNWQTKNTKPSIFTKQFLHGLCNMEDDNIKSRCPFFLLQNTWLF